MAESGSQQNCLYLINLQKMKPVVNDDSRLHRILAQCFLSRNPLKLGQSVIPFTQWGPKGTPAHAGGIPLR
jgi:hypothetical protein